MYWRYEAASTTLPGTKAALSCLLSVPSLPLPHLSTKLCVKSTLYVSPEHKPLNLRFMYRQKPRTQTITCFAVKKHLVMVCIPME